ncbi:hypothetical protein BKG77_15170 [Mycobacteroides chelonae]|nr:hypothetical protein BKG77_15170 [Mycobacteroides chelonae]
MIENASLLQARILARSLYEHINEVTEKLAVAERGTQSPNSLSYPSSMRRQRKKMALTREDLYEAHRLIEQLHRRFPETQGVTWPIEPLAQPRQPIAGEQRIAASTRSASLATVYRYPC